MKIKVDARLKFNLTEKEFLKERNLETGGAVQRYIDTECLRLMEPYIPFRTGALTRYGQINTRIGSGMIRYAPKGKSGGKSYAARLYYNPKFKFNKSFHTEAGAYWFDRMIAVRKQEILEGARQIAGAKQ